MSIEVPENAVNLLEGLKGPFIEKLAKEFTKEELESIEIYILNKGNLYYEFLQSIPAGEVVEEIVGRMWKYLDLGTGLDKQKERHQLVEDICAQIKANI